MKVSDERLCLEYSSCLQARIFDAVHTATLLVNPLMNLRDHDRMDVVRDHGVKCLGSRRNPGVKCSESQHEDSVMAA